MIRKGLTTGLTLMLTLIFISGCSTSASQLVLKGTVETRILSHYSQVAGKITKSPIELGQVVKAGDVIAEIDDSNDQYALEQLKTVLLKKQAALDDLKAGADPAEIKQGQDNVILGQKGVDRAQIAYDRSAKDYTTAQALFDQGVMTKANLDDAKYKADLAEIDLSSAQAQLDSANQKLTLLKKGPDQEKIAMAQADIAQSESQIRQTQTNLAKYKITAVSDGTVISKNYLLGALVAPGYNLADIALENEKYLVAYLPVDELPKISYGQELIIKKGKKEFKGTVNFIDVIDQYTPKDMQTSANKNKSSVKIKVKLAKDAPLKVGESADLLVTK